MAHREKIKRLIKYSTKLDEESGFAMHIALLCVLLQNHVLHRKEVIQPLVLQRLPCYDFTPVINPTFDSCLVKLAHRLRVLLTSMV